MPAIGPDVFLPLGQLRLPGATDAIQLGLSPQRVVAILMIALLTATNTLGVTLGAAIQTVFSVAKVGALAALVLFGLTIFRQPEIAAANFAGFWGTGDWSVAVIPVIGAAMVGSLFSSDAWNNVTFAAAEVQNPTRNLPRALAIGTGLVSLLYILANVAYLNILPFAGDPNGTTVLARGLQHAAQDRVGTAAIEVALGAGAATVMAVAILLSTFGCNNGLILSGPRVYYAMARDRLFFERAGTLHPTYRTPVFGLVAQALWASVLCISGTYNQLLDYVIFAAVVFYFLTTLALFRLRRTRPELPRPVQGLRLSGAARAVPAGQRRADGHPAGREAALHLARAADRGQRDPGLSALAPGRALAPDRLISHGPRPTLRDGTASFRPADRPAGA